MSGPNSNPFGAMMPGWDFLQNLGKAMPNHSAGTSGWVAPTLNVEDLEKRIQELKAVQYWLEQNARMLTATIQALEVQKMTLSTLKTMNVHVDELAQALKVKPEDFMNSWSQAVTPKPAATQSTREDQPQTPPGSSKAQRKGSQTRPSADGDGRSPDPLQWWGAVSQQFQEIAQTAAKDWQQHAAKAQEHLSAVSPKTPASKPKASRRPKSPAKAGASKRPTQSRSA